jgi:hypothetical protein
MFTMIFYNKDTQMQTHFLKSGVTEITPENMNKALQQAIEIEIATLPTYLSTYYSINRTPKQAPIAAKLTEILLAKGLNEQQALTQSIKYSSKIMVFANKAGANVMSVLVEEMLHMSLAANVKQAMFGDPELVNKSPTVWPAYLAGHEPAFPINRAKLSHEQLETFKLIESPKPFDKVLANVKAIPYLTIGEFYKSIERCIKQHYGDKKHYHPDRAQLVPNRGYYAQNNIDTIYYDKNHQPVYENAADAGGLIHVVDQASALAALAIIVEQGEGAGEGSDDDTSHHELAHYYKFAQLQDELAAIRQEFQTVFGKSMAVDKFFIHNFADNAKTADYPAAIAAVSTLTNAVYSYLFIMSQACYRADEHTQFEIFMFGIHKTMLWILSSLCGEMTGFTYVGSDGKQYAATATYEEYQFNAASTPKSQIIALFNQAVGGYSGIAYIEQRIKDLPDVALEGFLEKSKSPLMA